MFSVKKNICHIINDCLKAKKDFVRLNAKILKKQLYYLPIKSKLVSNQNAFDQIILNYVGTCTRNC